MYGMKNYTLIFACFLLYYFPLRAQPKLYLNLNSHNEMVGESYDTDTASFDTSTFYVHAIAQMVVDKNAKWNFQTNSKYVLAVHKFQDAAVSSTDILEWMVGTGHITIDPRPKTQLPFYDYNISDVAHLLDSAGVPDSKTVGGFIYYPYTAQDWTPYLSTVTGAHYGLPWNAQILWGAGSTPPHTYDAHNFGIWRPSGSSDSTAFYTNSSSGSLWIEGNGCSAVLYDTSSPVAVFNTIKEVANNIATGTWPSDKFYCMSVMINQRDFSGPFVLKVSQLLDSINTLVAENKVVWATIQEKFDTFQAWSTATSHTYSQWGCDQVASLVSMPVETDLALYPNPCSNELFLSDEIIGVYRIVDISGRILAEGSTSKNQTIVNLSSLIPGMYILYLADDKSVRRMRFIKE
jgi:hypothetical protein